MAKQRYVVRKNKQGNPIMVRLDERMVYRRDETVDDFKAQMRQSYYDLECRDGSRAKYYQPVKQIQEAWRG